MEQIVQELKKMNELLQVIVSNQEQTKVTTLETKIKKAVKRKTLRDYNKENILKDES